MTIYYIATRPETILTIIHIGSSPDNLPDWAEPKKIICAQSVAASVSTSNTNHHQTFILKIETPIPLISDEKIIGRDDLFIVRQINPLWIKQILTYSETGKKLLQRLLGEGLQIPILIVHEVYPTTVSASIPMQQTGSTKPISPLKRPSSEISLSPSVKPSSSASSSSSIGLNSSLSSNSSSSHGIISNSSLLTSTPSMSPRSKRARMTDPSPINLRRINTKEEHLEILRSAFNEARYTILITTYAINQDTLIAANLYKYIDQAIRRGVKIYCYYNDTKPIEQSVLRNFLQLGVNINYTLTHSKILAVDHTWCVLGSFNWLSAIDIRYPYSMNASIICRGEICQELVEDLWDYLKFYRNLQFGRFGSVIKFARENDGSIVYEIAPGEELSYLTTLDEHLGFLQEIFTVARKRIVICAPFISSAATYKEEFDEKTLRNTVQRGVEIFFICPPNVSSFLEFKALLASIRSPNIHLVEVANFHQKTIILDDTLIAEGSFNWLSASRDEGSDFHNHETTIIVKGELAIPLIANFYNSEIGNSILPILSSGTSQSKNIKTPAALTKDLAEQNLRAATAPTSLSSIVTPAASAAIPVPALASAPALTSTGILSDIYSSANQIIPDFLSSMFFSNSNFSSSSSSSLSVASSQTVAQLYSSLPITYRIFTVKRSEAQIEGLMEQLKQSNISIERILKRSTRGEINSFLLEIETNDLSEARVAVKVIGNQNLLDEQASSLPPRQQFFPM